MLLSETTTPSIGKFLYHRSNPIFRDKIEKEGLVPQIGESYELHWQDTLSDKEIIPRIFLFDSSQLYSSTYDDDLVQVDVATLDLTHLTADPDPELNTYCYMYDKIIPPTAIKFLYKGTGESDVDNAETAWHDIGKLNNLV